MVLDKKYLNSIFTQQIIVTSPAADHPTIDHLIEDRPAEDSSSAVCPAAVRSAAGCPATIDKRELSNENEKLPPCNQ